MANFFVDKDQLRHWRLARNLTQNELATALGVARSTINRWEKGIQALPETLEDTLHELRDRWPKRVSYFNSPDLYVRHFDKRRRKVHYTIKPEYAHLKNK